MFSKSERPPRRVLFVLLVIAAISFYVGCFPAGLN
jgi:hypothetical protein